MSDSESDSGSSSGSSSSSSTSSSSGSSSDSDSSSSRSPGVNGGSLRRRKKSSSSESAGESGKIRAKSQSPAEPSSKRRTKEISVDPLVSEQLDTPQLVHTESIPTCDVHISPKPQEKNDTEMVPAVEKDVQVCCESIEESKSAEERSPKSEEAQEIRKRLHSPGETSPVSKSAKYDLATAKAGTFDEQQSETEPKEKLLPQEPQDKSQPRALVVSSVETIKQPTNKTLETPAKDETQKGNPVASVKEKINIIKVEIVKPRSRWDNPQSSREIKLSEIMQDSIFLSRIAQSKSPSVGNQNTSPKKCPSKSPETSRQQLPESGNRLPSVERKGESLETKSNKSTEIQQKIVSERKHSRDCEKTRSKSKERKRSITPEQRRSKSKERKRSKTRERRRSRTKESKRSKTPEKNQKKYKDTNIESKALKRGRSKSRERKRSLSSERTRGKSKERKESNSPERIRRKSRERKRSNSPDRRRGKSRERKQSKSPQKIRSKAKERKQSSSPERIQSKSIERKRTNTSETTSKLDEKRPSVSPEKIQKTLKEREQSKSPERFLNKSKERKRSISRENTQSKSKEQEQIKSPERFLNKSKERKRSISRENTQSKSEEQEQSKSPELIQRKSKERKQSKSPERIRNKSKERKRSRSPEKRRNKTPERRRSRTPNRRRSKTPERKRSRSPLRKRSKSPMKRNYSKSPSRRRRSRSASRRVRSRSPIGRKTSKSPDRRNRSRTPERRNRSRSPDKRRFSQSPTRNGDRRATRRSSRSRSPRPDLSTKDNVAASKNNPDTFPDPSVITQRQRRTVDLLTSKTGGAYIPPAKLRLLQAEITDKTTAAYQRIAWEALKKSIHGYINKVNVDNIGIITRELLKENIIRGRGLICRSIIQAQAASPTFTHVYAALVAIINSKFPNIGELLLRRLVIQFKRGFRRNDKSICISASRFIAHLVNQRVAHEILALEILTLLVETPTDDSVEVAIAFLKECGMKLTEVSSKGVNAIFEMLKNILHEGKLDKRVQYMIEVVFQVRKDGFKDHQSVIEALELVEEDDQFTHLIMLDEATDAEDVLNVFKFDDQYETNEDKYKGLSKEILGSDASGSDDESGSGSDDSDDDEEGKDGEKKGDGLIIDNTETNLVALRRTIYLTIHSSLDYEECAHKLMKMELKPGQEMELCHMFLDCCAEQRTYEKFYGLLAQRFCLINKIYVEPFEEIFKDTYHTTHRLDTNRLRNVSKFFAHLLFTDAIGWDVLECIKLNEDDTTSSSRIFIKILFQELAEYMGLTKLNERLKDATLGEAFNGLFPRDNPRNTRFAINFFTSIGLGGLTDELREFLKSVPKNVPTIANPETITITSNKSSSSSSSSSTSSSSSDSSSSSSSSDSSDDSSSSTSSSSSSSSNSSESDRGRRSKKNHKKKPIIERKKKLTKKKSKKIETSSSSSSSSDSDDDSSEDDRRKKPKKKQINDSKKKRVPAKDKEGRKKKEQVRKDDVKQKHKSAPQKVNDNREDGDRDRRRDRQERNEQIVNNRNVERNSRRDKLRNVDQNGDRGVDRTRKDKKNGRPSPVRRSPDRRDAKRRSAERHNPFRTSPDRRSPKRRSPKRRDDNRRRSAERMSPIRRRSPERMSPIRRRSPERISPIRRRSPERMSPIRRRSPERMSPIRRSPKRKGSPARQSPVRRSPVRRSPVRRSPKRRSPERRSRKDERTTRGSYEYSSRERNGGDYRGSKQKSRRGDSREG